MLIGFVIVGFQNLISLVKFVFLLIFLLLLNGTIQSVRDERHKKLH